MRHTFILMFSLSVFCFFACKSDSKNITPKEVNEELAKSKPTQDTVKMPEVSTINAQTFDILEGKLYWLSKKTNSSDSYCAEIKVVGGSCLVDKNFIMNGKITLDVTSVACLGSEDVSEKQKKYANILVEQAGKEILTDKKLVQSSQEYLSKIYSNSKNPWGFHEDSFWVNYPELMIKNKAILDADGQPIKSIDYKSLYTNQLLP